jgi:hypothetical protein
MGVETRNPSAEDAKTALVMSMNTPPVRTAEEVAP